MFTTRASRADTGVQSSMLISPRLMSAIFLRLRADRLRLLRHSLPGGRFGLRPVRCRGRSLVCIYVSVETVSAHTKAPYVSYVATVRLPDLF